MRFKLLYNYTERGPGVVISNLTKGLILNGHEIVSRNEKTDFCISLQNPLAFPELKEEIDIVGPNVLISEILNFSYVLTPCQWIHDYFKSKKELTGKDIHVWSVGIDTNAWDLHHIKSNDALIYRKHTSHELLDEAINLCKLNNLSYEIVNYGSYNESDFMKIANRSKFAILLTKTETQGIAYMQLLSSGLPCFVFDKDIWDDYNDVAPATSSPYFSNLCGVKIDRKLIFQEKCELFFNFLNLLHTFDPRKYILDNHTLEISAKKIENILFDIRNK